MNEFVKGNVVRCSTTFTNLAGAAIDPTTVSFSFKTPAGVTTTYVYPTDAQLVKDSTGNYHVDISADTEGTYYWRFFSTGTGKAAYEGSFAIPDSEF